MNAAAANATFSPAAGADRAMMAHAAAGLEQYFSQRVTAALPGAIERLLHDGTAVTGWLANECLRIDAATVPVLDMPVERYGLGAFCVPTLLCMLLDTRQPADVCAAVRNELVHKLLADPVVARRIQRDAEACARADVQALVQRRDADTLAEHRQQFDRLSRGMPRGMPLVPVVDDACMG